MGVPSARPFLSFEETSKYYFVCLYFTKLAPIFKIANVLRAERVVALTQNRTLVAPPASAIAPAVTSQKFSLTIFLLRAPPEKN
ncbi:hypothetical protein AUJ77_00185 [Candidatus Nomurabacteria bacterium CG1_02_43_90]|uniref:Uncharacterized protein n=1 Tax=Candidatus Nomurabacteria bacterium CG1_02_43_90 TaxID=1805281 RepID=A0A1J4V9J0_9BACT|nr:MAG: hypothetical protein AUJ77_00185 [Candidatus Nomurabacteria bacterium CG1_02_43_90]